MNHQRTILLKDQRIPFIFKKYSRSRNIRITIRQNRGLLVTAPSWVRINEVEKFLVQKTDWILKSFREYQVTVKGCEIKSTIGSYEKYKMRALVDIKKLVQLYNKFYQFEFKKIFVKNHYTVWGSCSSDKNLNFNYRVYFLPNELKNYIIVHELCHLKEMNHGPEFWRLVQLRVPEYNDIRRRLNRINF